MIRAGTLIAVVCALALPASAGAGLESTQRPIHSSAPDANRVREYLVRVHDPLPADVGPHPRACDRLQYLRFRDAGGPPDARDADAVISLMPGFLGGSSNFDQVARNTIRDAAKRGKHLEVWAIDRRSNCLEDNTGVRAAQRAKDATVAWQYYWGGREVGGRRFSGFVSPSDAAFLSSFGLERTMRDWYDVNRAGMPSRRMRAKKMICGGHSLGGPLTAAYAGWDFDGNPNTTRDAGFRQCAAFVGFDTTLAIGGGSAAGSGLLGFAGGSGGSPYINLPPLTPETFEVPSVFGVADFLAPNGTDALGELPHTSNIDLAQRLLFSRDAAHFATGEPNIRDFHLTNDATLAGVFDDNSAPLFFLRSSVGFLAGGPVVEKDFPTPDPSLALPGEPATPLYDWVNYNRVRDAEVPVNSSGAPFTSRESEVSDLRQLARTMFEAPANFIEQYFPTRILTDVAAASSGDRGGSLANIRYDGIPRRPALVITAGDSGSNSAPDNGPPQVQAPPNDNPLSRHISIPGYNHLDVVTAARRQNDGEPEPSSTALTRFVLSVTR
ncbi:MAG: hypothetical protein ACJ75R_05675 [Solirubrobacterales bacterium]